MKDTAITDCLTSAFAGDPATCRWCATPLPLTKNGKPPRNRRWCGEDCSQGFWINHLWKFAREAALRRDGWICAGCGQVGWRDVPHGVLDIANWPVDHARPYSEADWAVAIGWLYREDIRGHVDPAHHRRIRQVCEQLPDGVRAVVGAEHMRTRRYRPYRGRTHDLEVNHIEPRRGQGYTSGCHNHLANLQTLCRACHTAVTAAQRRARARGHQDVIDPQDVARHEQPTLLEAG